MKLKQKAKATIRKDTISNAHLRKSKTSKGKLLRVVQRKTKKSKAINVKESFSLYLDVMIQFVFCPQLCMTVILSPDPANN